MKVILWSNQKRNIYKLYSYILGGSKEYCHHQEELFRSACRQDRPSHGEKHKGENPALVISITTVVIKAVRVQPKRTISCDMKKEVVVAIMRQQSSCYSCSGCTQPVLDKAAEADLSRQFPQVNHQVIADH